MHLLTSQELEEYGRLKDKIEAKERSRYMLSVYGATAFFTFQFAVSYYAIFCVPWLGWDLVEPMTYTVS